MVVGVKQSFQLRLADEVAVGMAGIHGVWTRREVGVGLGVAPREMRMETAAA